MLTKIDFHVVHASGQDDQCRAQELNEHSINTKGWQSSRYCLYPQDIVIQLNKGSCRLRKIQLLSHQCLIATKVEIYVGDVIDGVKPSLSQAKYTRLGYIALSDNERSGFKARELKSVQVDALGQYVKFVIHKNHVNKHNVYNQVGLVAINVIGDDVNSDLHNSDPKDPSLAAIFRPDYISPVHDLAFDMYQDPQVAAIIRRLDKKKQKAALAENFDTANKLKTIINQLYKAGEKLGKYEVEKRHAVESEDYDKAQLKKIQIEEYRNEIYAQLQLPSLLDEKEMRIPDKQIKLPARDRSYSPPVRLPRMDPTSPLTPHDEKPLPAIKKQNPPSPVEQEMPTTSYDDKPLPVNTKSNKADDDENDQSGNVTGEPEPMSERDQRLASHVIDAFGLPLVSKGYSKTWSFREDAMIELYSKMSELEMSTPRDESKSMFRAAIFMNARGIKDKIHAVYLASLNLLKLLLNEYIDAHRPSKQDILYACEKTLKALFTKCGDTAQRSRDTAKQFVVDMSTFPEIKPLGHILQECVKPFSKRNQTAPRLAISRVEILHQLYNIHKLSPNGLTIANMMTFLNAALEHTSGEVREGAEKLIIELYRDHGAPVKGYLPQDNDKTRKNLIYKQMFEAFDKIDGKLSKKELKKQKDEADLAKKKEVEALQAELNQLRSLNNNAAKAGQGDPPKKEKQPTRRAAAKPTPQPPEPIDDDTSTLFPVDKTCIFCGEQNDSFTEEGLDLHYWKTCPVLKRCNNCKQVVEIVGLTDHLLTECQDKENYSQCPRCSEAILKTEFDQHVKEKSCNPSEAGKQQCPMCKNNIPGDEEEFKNHLMSKDGCKHNPRRLTALNNKQQAPKAGGGKKTGRK